MNQQNLIQNDLQQNNVIVTADAGAQARATAAEERARVLETQLNSLKLEAVQFRATVNGEASQHVAAAGNQAEAAVQRTQLCEGKGSA